MEQQERKYYHQAYEELLQSRERVVSLTKKLEEREREFSSRKTELDDLCARMNQEKKDVTNLEKFSLSRVLAKIAGNYDDKYQKEYQEFINIKLKYDELNSFIYELQQEIDRQKNDINKEQRNAKRLEEELLNIYPEARERAAQIEEKKKALYRKQVEVREAIAAVIRVNSLTDQALDTYKSAKGWSTYDTFFNGGLLADLAKYSKVDEAQEITNQMRAASNSMKKELNDVKIQFEDDIDGIDNGVRGFDIFFDNIFTDWSVRNRIEENIDTLKNYKNRLNLVLESLRRTEKDIEKEIVELQL